MPQWLEKIKDRLKNVHYISDEIQTPEKVLEKAFNANLESLSVIGWTQDGKLWMNSTYNKSGDMYWDLNVAAREVMK